MPQVFISYSRKDLSFVEHLAEDLKAFGLEVWYDLSGLDGGTRWGREIQAAIQRSQIFVVVLSPNSIDSEWVEKEFMYANSLKRKIIPLLYQPCETPMWFINLHFIDVQGSNYDSNFRTILKAMGVKVGDKAKIDKLPVDVPPIRPYSRSQIQPSNPVEPEEKKTVLPSRKIKIVPVIIFSLLGLAAVLAISVWGMPALAARLAPSPTPTATATHTPTATSRPNPTSTSTPTPTQVPSPTFTVAPTSDPATGRVSGSIGWNNQPFAGVVVKLCTQWLYNCTGIEFTGTTNVDGEFTIPGILPGKYQVITKYPGQIDETRLQSSSTGQAGLPLVITVMAGRLTQLDPVAICKVDLVLFAPDIKGNSVTFSWKAYPGASTYGFWIANQNIGAFFLPATSFTATLPPGNYQWTVLANGSACSRGIGNLTLP